MSIFKCVFPCFYKMKHPIDKTENNYSKADQNATFLKQNKLQIGKVRKYLVSKASRKSLKSSKQKANLSQTSQTEEIQKSSYNKQNSDSAKKEKIKINNETNNRISKINHLSRDENEDQQFARSPSREYVENASNEEASLTQIVIAQIEQDNNERNRKAFDSVAIASKLEPEGVKCSLDRNQGELSDSIDGKNEEQGAMESMRQVPLRLTNTDQVDEDPIYDVPPSKSLVNLNATADEEVSLQKQHHIQLNDDLAYFHTSSPNLCLTVQQEESIYDTPSTRSLAI